MLPSTNHSEEWKWWLQRLSVRAFSSGLPHRAFCPWTWEESSTSCLSAVPWCLERAHGLFNSQPIFCPSHHFIPTLELSSGPHIVTFWHILQPTPRQYQKILSVSPRPQLTFNMKNKLYFQTGCRNRASCLPPHTNPLHFWLFLAACAYVCVIGMTPRVEQNKSSGFSSRQITPCLSGDPSSFCGLSHMRSHMLIIMSGGGFKAAQHAQPSEGKEATPRKLPFSGDFHE